jgi:hypothetical protein
MSDSDFNIFVERVITVLRSKRNKPERKCTTKEIIDDLGRDKTRDIHRFRTTNFFTKLMDEIKDNPRIHYDKANDTFEFKKRFQSVEDLMHRLNSEKRGVREDEDLYDDVDKKVIEQYKKEGKIREIKVETKKSQPPILVIFGRDPNFESPLHFENPPETLKKIWEKVDNNEMDRWVRTHVQREQVEYRPIQSRIKKKGEKRYRRNDYFDQPERWGNKHLLDKVEEAFHQLQKRAPKVKKHDTWLNNN